MKRFLIVTVLLLTAFLFLPVPAQAAPTALEVSQPQPLDDLYTTFKSLSGVAALVAALVNAGKIPGWVKNDKAPEAMMILNMVGFMALGALQMTGRGNLVPMLDQQAGSLANVLTVVLGYVVQLLVSRLTHQHVLAGLPILGKSHDGRLAGQGGVIVDISRLDG